MKPSEMTNEELATQIEDYNTIDGCSCSKCEYMREAAARLRKSEERVSKQKASNKELVDEVADLSRRLKVAEDALDKVYKCIDNRYGVDASLLAKKIIEDALAAISEEGEVK